MSRTVLKQSFSVHSKIDSFFTGNKIEISCDSKLIFSPCCDVLKVIDVNDGQIVKEVKSEIDDKILTFGLSEDSQRLVIAYESGLMRQWLWSEDKLERSWKSIHTGPVVLVVLDRTNSLVATAGTDSTIKVYHSVDNYYTHNLRGAVGVFSCVNFSPIHSNESYLIYGAADDYNIHVWDLITSEHKIKLEGHCSKVTAIRFSLNKQQILTCSRDNLVIVWNISNHQKVRSIPVFESLESIQVIDSQKVSVIDSENNRKVFISAGEKGILRVWNFETGQLLHTQQNSLLALKSEENVTTNNQLIVQMIYCKNTSEIAVISFENNIIFHKLEDLSPIKQFVGNNDEVLDIKFLGESDSHIAVATNSRNIKVFELKTFNCFILKGHSDIVLSLETYPKDPYTLISSSKDNSIRVWKFSKALTDWTCNYYASGHTHSVTALSLPNINTNFFVSGSEDCTLKIWKIPKADCSVSFKPDIGIPLIAKLTQHSHEKTINSIAISPNDQLIASGSQDKTAKIWTADGLELLGVMRGHKKSIWCLQFSPVDQILVTSSADASIKIWALKDYSCLKTFQGHDCSVLKLLFIDRGIQLISSATDGNIKIWNLKDNECVKTIDAHNDKIWALTKSNDESLLISGGSDSLILIWKDVTHEEKDEIAVKQENQVKSEQNLLNLIQKKKWSKALKIAIKLDHPYRALSIIKETLTQTNGFNQLDRVLSDLREDQLIVLLEYALFWNTNSKHYIASQFVLKAIFHKISPKELIKVENFKQKLEKLIPYTERHLNRLTRLQQYVTFVDFVWESIKLPEIESNELNSSINNININDKDIENIDGTEYVTISENSDDSDSENL